MYHRFQCQSVVILDRFVKNSPICKCLASTNKQVFIELKHSNVSLPLKFRVLNTVLTLITLHTKFFQTLQAVERFIRLDSLDFLCIIVKRGKQKNHFTTPLTICLLFQEIEWL